MIGVDIVEGFCAVGEDKSQESEDLIGLVLAR